VSGEGTVRSAALPSGQPGAPRRRGSSLAPGALAGPDGPLTTYEAR